MKDRLLQFLNKNQMSATHLADEIGVQRSSVSHVLSGRNNPSYDFIYKILNRFDELSADWLISGKGDMYRSAQTARPTQQKKASQPDLFSSVSNNAPPEANKTFKSSQKEEIDTDAPEINTSTAGKKLEKIILLYDDGTFQYYRPT